MEPFYIRLSTVIFAGLTVTTVANALYFQSPISLPALEVDERASTAAISKVPYKQMLEVGLRSPARRISQETSRKILLSKEKIRTAVIRANTVSNAKKRIASSNQVIAIQRGLKELGYNPGYVDGVAGLKTRAAIMAFEYDNGQMVVGDSSESVLNKILKAHRVKYPRKALELTYSASAREVVTLVQKLLSAQGYSPGQIDGLMGEETFSAVRRFEKDRFMPQSGRISGQLIQEFVKVGAKVDQVANK